MTHETSFNIRTAREFFEEVVLPQYEEFLKDKSSVRHALLSIIVAYHMYEWVYKSTYTKTEFNHRIHGKSDVAEHFEMARRITNGTKHFQKRQLRPNDIVRTRRKGGFSPAFSDAFARPALFIEKLNCVGEIDADDLLASLIGFWKDQRNNRVF